MIDKQVAVFSGHIDRITGAEQDQVSEDHVVAVLRLEAGRGVRRLHEQAVALAGVFHPNSPRRRGLGQLCVFSDAVLGQVGSMLNRIGMRRVKTEFVIFPGVRVQSSESVVSRLCTR